MTEQVSTVLESVLSLLPWVVGCYAVIALIVGIRGIQIARSSAYKAMHDDFIDLKERVRKELRKD